MTISTEQLIAYQSGQEMMIIPDGGDLTVQRYKVDGTWTDVENSPVLNGQEKLIITHSHNGMLKLIPSATLSYTNSYTKR